VRGTAAARKAQEALTSLIFWARKIIVRGERLNDVVLEFMSNSVPVDMTRWGKHDVLIKMKKITDSL
jgi:hypothetical protein